MFPEYVDEGFLIAIMVSGGLIYWLHPETPWPD